MAELVGDTRYDLAGSFSHPEAVAFISDGRVTTYSELDRRAELAATGFRAAGLEPGERVFALLPSCAEVYELLIGCVRAGLVFVPGNWRLAAEELAGVVRDAAPRAVVLGPGFDSHAALLREAAPGLRLELRVGSAKADPAAYEPWLGGQGATRGHRAARHVHTDSDVALQIYTSGTSGKPKGVLLTHGNLAAKIPRAASSWRFAKNSVSLLATPLFHVGGLGWGLVGLHAGATTVIAGTGDPDALIDLMRTRRVTHTFLVPTMITRLCEQARGVALPDLSVMVYGASPITAATQEAALETFDCALFHVYGLTETTGSFTQLETRGAHVDRRLAGSAGLPFSGVELSVRDPLTGSPVPAQSVGEIWTRSAQNTPGYFADSKATRALLTDDGWLRTGDAGYVDDNGYLFLTDRVKDLIVTGGENVYPVEVENVLREHPGVADVAVIGLPDPLWGERVAAVIVTTHGHRLSEEDVIEASIGRLAAYKRPREVHFVSTLPHNATGKVQKHRLVARFGSAAQEALHGSA